MILVARPSKPFTFTTKKTVRRGAILREYEAEIDALYDAFEESTQSDIVPPSTWEAEDIFAYVSTVVTRVLKKGISDVDDIFEHGCDRYVALISFCWRCKKYLYIAFKLLGFVTHSCIRYVIQQR